MTLPFETRDTPKPPGGSALVRYLARFDDGAVVRWAFRGLLLGCIGVLSMDLMDLSRSSGWMEPASTPESAQPILPPAVEIGAPAPGIDPRPFVTTDMAVLERPMAFSLEAGGILKAVGTIEPGTSDRLEEELAVRGEYVRAVALDSPGGALEDAMAMARALRARGLDATVQDGAICASSCPLVLAGGKTRGAGDRAAVGVHQFYAASLADVRPEQVMADAQATTARISRHLSEMGVDPALWLHALDTPPRALYYLSAEELRGYKLVTSEPKRP